MAPKMRPTPKFGMMQDGAARAAHSHPNYASAAALAAAESSPTRVASREGAVFPVAEAIAFWEQKSPAKRSDGKGAGKRPRPSARPDVARAASSSSDVARAASAASDVARAASPEVCDIIPYQDVSRGVPAEHPPTQLDLSELGHHGGRLFLASADWACHIPWLEAIGCTLLWECLDRKCGSRARIDAKVDAVLYHDARHYGGEMGYLNWYYHSGIPGTMLAPRWARLKYWHRTPMYENMLEARQMEAAPFEVINEHIFNEGGTVVCFCVEGKHRSPASVVAWLVQARGVSFEKSWRIVAQHGDTRLQWYAYLSQLRREARTFVAGAADDVRPIGASVAVLQENVFDYYSMVPAAAGAAVTPQWSPEPTGGAAGAYVMLHGEDIEEEQPRKRSNSPAAKGVARAAPKKSVAFAEHDLEYSFGVEEEIPSERVIKPSQKSTRPIIEKLAEAPPRLSEEEEWRLGNEEARAIRKRLQRASKLIESQFTAEDHAMCAEVARQAVERAMAKDASYYYR